MKNSFGHIFRSLQKNIQEDLQIPLLGADESPYPITIRSDSVDEDKEDKSFHRITIYTANPFGIQNLAFPILALLEMKDVSNYLMVNKLHFIYGLRFLNSNQFNRHQDAIELVMPKVSGLLKKMLGSNANFIDEEKIETSLHSLEESKSDLDLPLTLINEDQMDSFFGRRCMSPKVALIASSVVSLISNGGFIILFDSISIEPWYLGYILSSISGAILGLCSQFALLKCGSTGRGVGYDPSTQEYIDKARPIIASLKNHTQLPQLKLLQNYLIWHRDPSKTHMPENLNSLYNKFCDSLQMN